jgi:hypothetical protein
MARAGGALEAGIAEHPGLGRSCGTRRHLPRRVKRRGCCSAPLLSPTARGCAALEAPAHACDATCAGAAAPDSVHVWRKEHLELSVGWDLDFLGRWKGGVLCTKCGPFFLNPLSL